MMGGVIILGWVAFAALVGFGIHTAILLYASFEARRLKRLDEARGNHAYGDWPSIPDDFKALHGSQLGTGAQQDHA